VDPVHGGVRAPESSKRAGRIAAACRQAHAGWHLRRAAAYAWTAPNTLLGLLAALAVLCTGGRIRRVGGTLECCGGLLASLACAAPPPLRFVAITLGHVIVGVDGDALAAARGHERVHVAQYEAWGPLFLPAYLASSAWQLLRGGRPYLDNHFEKQARARCAGEGQAPRSRCDAPRHPLSRRA
jgi:hypothetical protein